MKNLMLICMIVAALMVPMAAQARVGVFIGPGFGWGPYWGPYPYWGGYYAPYGPYGYYGYYGGPPAGELKFDTKLKDTQVFINGAYAGTVGQLKTMHMRPGTYNIELRAAGRPPYDERVFVAAGKTVHLNPDVPPTNAAPPPPPPQYNNGPSGNGPNGPQQFAPQDPRFGPDQNFGPPPEQNPDR